MEQNNEMIQLILDFTDLLRNYSIITTRFIEVLENKIEKERKENMIQSEKLNDYDKIILNDIKGRISILEEESQEYEVN